MADQEPAAPAEPQQENSTTPEPESRTAEDNGGEQDWKALARKWEREAKKSITTVSKYEQELEKLREAQQTDTEKAIAAARREGAKAAEAEWRGKWRQERLHTAALQAMGGRVSDPRLALPHLKFSDDLLDDDGNVDAKALTEAVDELLDTFPTLASGSAPAHHADLGPKRRAATPPQDMNTLLRQAAGRS